VRPSRADLSAPDPACLFCGPGSESVISASSKVAVQAGIVRPCTAGHRPCDGGGGRAGPIVVVIARRLSSDRAVAPEAESAH